MKYHAGWAANGVREDSAASRQDRVFIVSLSSSDSTPTSCTRGDLLQVVNRHGNYTTLDGRHRLVVVDVSCSFFTSLHSTIHSVLSKEAIREHRSRVLQHVMDHLAHHRKLRTDWKGFLEAVEQPMTVATAVLWQNICRY